MEDQTSKIRQTIMQELGLENLPQEKQEELLVKMGEVIFKKIFLATVEKLDDEGKNRFEKMMEEGNSPEEIESFLSEKIDNYDEILDKIIQDLKKDMKGAIAQ